MSSNGPLDVRLYLYILYIYKYTVTEYIQDVLCMYVYVRRWIDID